MFNGDWNSVAFKDRILLDRFKWLRGEAGEGRNHRRKNEACKGLEIRCFAYAIFLESHQLNMFSIYL